MLSARFRHKWSLRVSCDNAVVEEQIQITATVSGKQPFERQTRGRLDSVR